MTRNKEPGRLRRPGSFVTNTIYYLSPSGPRPKSIFAIGFSVLEDLPMSADVISSILLPSVGLLVIPLCGPLYMFLTEPTPASLLILSAVVFGAICTFVINVECT